MPLNPNHAYCAFLSVSVSLAGPKFWRPGQRIEREAGLEALEFLRRLGGTLHNASRTDDPIGISDRMSGSDEILYVPLMFGYSNYARPAFRPWTLTFGNAPRGSSGTIGSVLGGVGMALSAQSRSSESAAALAREIGSAPVQSGSYARSGGQPGHGAAWDSPDVNALVGGFFTATRETIDQAFIRPRVAGHRQFQPAAGELIHDFIWNDRQSVRECLEGFEKLADSLLSA